MSTAMLDPVDTHASGQSPGGQSLRATMAAMRLAFSWFGTRKTLTNEQKARAADAFDAEGKFLSAAKRLIDTSDPNFRAVSSIKSQVTTFFKGVSLPFPEPGIRLIRQGDVGEIDAKMRCFADELEQAVAELDNHLGELKHEARQRLGSLFNDEDYPASVIGLFELSWEYVSLEPPAYLMQLNPELYEAECDRVRAKFDTAVSMAEAAFAEELTKLVEHLSDRLSGTEDGKPKTFRNSVVENFSEFFERFRMLNIRSNDQLDEVVRRAESVLDGVGPQQLRDSTSLRDQIATGLASVQSTLDGLMIQRPRRNIIRKVK